MSFSRVPSRLKATKVTPISRGEVVLVIDAEDLVKYAVEAGCLENPCLAEDWAHELHAHYYEANGPSSLEEAALMGLTAGKKVVVHKRFKDG